MTNMVSMGFQVTLILRARCAGIWPDRVVAEVHVEVSRALDRKKPECLSTPLVHKKAYGRNRRVFFVLRRGFLVSWSP